RLLGARAGGAGPSAYGALRPAVAAVEAALRGDAPAPPQPPITSETPVPPQTSVPPLPHGEGSGVREAQPDARTSRPIDPPADPTLSQGEREPVVGERP